jgi:phosphatidylserine decarboxylase
MPRAAHQYVERDTAAVRTERLFGDRLVCLLYGRAREDPGVLLRLLTSRLATRLLACLSYDTPLARRQIHRFARSVGADLTECVDPPERLDTARKVFERQIRYWDVRPMEDDERAVVSPADARVLLGSLVSTSQLFLKGKFFALDELLGPDRTPWLTAFRDGDFAIFRLTPDKYHYNHAPVAGTVLDIYEVGGDYHSCNPGPVVAVAVPYSKNRRVVTIIDTDVPGGTRAGRVAMIEVVALMIGDVVQCYSGARYDGARPVRPGLFLDRGQPKSLYRPGSSTDVLLFERGRVEFCPDLLLNMARPEVQSRFSQGFGRPLAETDVRVRSTIARAVDRRPAPTEMSP